jgi:multidrug transporter EmrE-like cation transporter
MPQSTLILSFAIAIVPQIAAASLLPATRGFTALIPTATCLVLFGVSFWMMARLRTAALISASSRQAWQLPSPWVR